MYSDLGVIFQMVTRLAMLLVFIRFMLQFAGIERTNFYAMPAYKATKVVDVFGRIFPTVANGRVSIAAIVLMFLIRLMTLSGLAALESKGYPPVRLFFEASITLILEFLMMCRYLIIGSIIISWIVMFTQSMHPILGIIMQLAEPILAPFRRISPDLGMIDISPIFAFFALYLCQMVVTAIAVSLLPMLG